MVALPGSASERRQVSVLFCDVVDSTGLSERCDPEDLREILLEFQAISTRCIEDAGGAVVNYIGDGIRCEFGYPVVSENEAENAVRAGLKLLRSIEQLSERSTAAIQERLRVRIGVHTGLAVIGRAGQGHVHDATEIVGDTPNIAARLQEIADPGSMVISGDTLRLLRGKFHVRELGIRTLKGLSRSIQVFHVLGEAIQGKITRRGLHRNASPMVGRSGEIRELLRVWELAKTGRGCAVEITGEAGIGKSRLALELIDQTDLPEDSIVALQASADHQNTPFFPIIRMLGQRIGISKDDSLAANATRLSGFLAGMPTGDDEQHLLIGQLLGLPLSHVESTTVPDARELRRKTFEIVMQLLMSHANGYAGVLLVEDFHWADPSTVEVIERIAGRIDNVPLLLMITGRTETTRASSELIRRISLQRLADDECRILADSVVRDEQLSGHLLERIIARSDGVPLFVEELVAAALETGRVDPGAHASVVADRDGVPSALYDSLMLRLERLGEAKAIAQVASVIGRSFSHQLLLIASEHGPALESALARLLASGLVRLEQNSEETVYSFKHALVRDVAYYSLLKRQRRELHARVAEAIEAHLPEIADREPNYLAQHLSEAGRTSRAVQMWTKAAKQSAERSANLEALAQLGIALEHIKKLPDGVERDDLELNAQIALIGPTIALQGFSAPAVAEVSNRAVELCRALNDDPRIFPALYARWSNLRVTGSRSKACALAQDFLALAEQKGTRTERMVGHRLLGTSLLDSETAQAREHLEGAANLYDATSDWGTAVIYGTDVQVTSLSNLGIVNWLFGHVEEAVACGRSALGLARRLRHAHTLGYAFAHACMIHTLERDPHTVEPLARELLADATRWELPLWMSVARTFLGWSEVESGRLAAGIETLEEQRDFLQTAPLTYWLPTYLCWLAEAYVRCGKVMKARLCLEQARDVIGREGNYWYEAECLRLEGCLAAHPQIDDAALAERRFEEALTLSRQRGQKGFALRAAHELAEYLASAGRPERARLLLSGITVLH